MHNKIKINKPINCVFYSVASKNLLFSKGLTTFIFLNVDNYSEIQYNVGEMPILHKFAFDLIMHL